MKTLEQVLAAPDAANDVERCVAGMEISISTARIAIMSDNVAGARQALVLVRRAADEMIVALDAVVT